MKSGDTIRPRAYATIHHLEHAERRPPVAIMSTEEVAEIMAESKQRALEAHQRDLAGMSDDDGARAESVIVWAAVAVLAVSIVGIACAFL